MQRSCVIVGASHAGAQLAASLRQEGWEGSILMIGDEPLLPYNRPPLSKTYLAGEKEFDDIVIRHRESYDRFRIDLRLGCKVESIDRPTKQLKMQDGSTVAYDKLALCTGARVRTLPDTSFKNMLYLRTCADLEALRPHIVPNARGAIIGGGYIGLETAAALRKFGVDVTVIEAASRVLSRVTAPELSAFYHRVHTEEGVDIRTGVSISGYDVDPADSTRVTDIRLSDGMTIRADFIVVGIGVLPNTELAEAAGLSVNSGIVTDDSGRTSDPDIVAAGDCTIHPVQGFGTMRLESVGNAVEQAKAAAATVCGKNKPDHSVPWFWSDQYDLKLQMVGLSSGYDQLVLRGNPDNGRSFAAFYLRESRLIAVDCVNRPAEFILSKKLIADRRIVDPAGLADETRSFKELVA